MKHEPNVKRNVQGVIVDPPHVVAISGKRGYPKRVPSSVPASSRSDAALSFWAGRNLHQIAKNVPCSTLVVIEEALRSLDRRVSQLRNELRGRKAA